MFTEPSVSGDRKLLGASRREPFAYEARNSEM